MAGTNNHQTENSTLSEWSHYKMSDLCIQDKMQSCRSSSCRNLVETPVDSKVSRQLNWKFSTGESAVAILSISMWAEMLLTKCRSGHRRRGGVINVQYRRYTVQRTTAMTDNRWISVRSLVPRVRVPLWHLAVITVVWHHGDECEQGISCTFPWTLP